MGMFDAPSGWQQRLLDDARQRQALQDAQENQRNPLASVQRGPDTMFHDPNWQAYFEALSQAGVDKIKAPASSPFQTSPEPISQSYHATPMSGVADPMGTPDTMRAPDSMLGLMKATGGMVNSPADVKKRRA